MKLIVLLVILPSALVDGISLNRGTRGRGRTDGNYTPSPLSSPLCARDDQAIHRTPTCKAALPSGFEQLKRSVLSQASSLCQSGDASSCSDEECKLTPGIIDYHHQGEDWSCGQCGCRNRQSPIDLPVTAPVSATTFKYGFLPAGSMCMANTGFTIELRRQTITSDAIPNSFEGACPSAAPSVSDTDQADIEYDGGSYVLDNIHFHAPAEHTFQGQRHSLEMHVVTKFIPATEADANKTHFLVLGFTFVEGQSSAFLEEILSRGVPAVSNRVTLIPSQPRFDVNELIREAAEFIYYPGSLTVPPCSENVEWFVNRRPLEASPAQLAVFLAEFTSNECCENSKGNYRVTQNHKNQQLHHMAIVKGVPLAKKRPFSLGKKKSSMRAAVA
ncbi:unnamed protein product [Vitrella brassicaformis CCMP3155]|uniref:carbonic anhydrase n=1 Tax=Vitrella brassicaformis (strain CCMP3155) TaxID=1169540 RepID=A0A0G4F3T5_VITBC|nr:unnamed protein product [Vitrella brassicaformis CCMP3155]|mmetsp:Transcript_47139/g.117573  ORF Transcript_47139/g.117573 Transcript_47139/m.117573 type:complete len:387 (-) Transcript_47139:864-2024(-)|eukprot:CEM06500.1 unnamed protein product [Vitrella brassicaformis CCMP3155]